MGIRHRRESSLAARRWREAGPHRRLDVVVRRTLEETGSSSATKAPAFLCISERCRTTAATLPESDDRASNTCKSVPTAAGTTLMSLAFSPDLPRQDNCTNAPQRVIAARWPFAPFAANNQRGTRPDVLRPDAVLLSNLSCTSKKAASGFVPSSSPLQSNAAILSPFLATQALAGPVPVALSAKSQLSCASSAMTMTLLDVTRTHSSFVSAVAARTSSSSLSVMGVVVAVPSAKTWSVMSAVARAFVQSAVRV